MNFTNSHKNLTQKALAKMPRYVHYIYMLYEHILIFIYPGFFGPFVNRGWRLYSPRL